MVQYERGPTKDRKCERKTPIEKPLEEKSSIETESDLFVNL
jgi:hypothetical protein